MEQTAFERPREKLQHAGASALTNPELLQIIIGSGSARMPVAKIARQVSQALARLDTITTYKSLTAISGVGAANASRVIASIELGKRLQQSSTRIQPLDITQLQRSRRKSVLYVTLNGNGVPLSTVVHQLKPSDNATLLARRLCAKVLSDNAWGISVAIGSSKSEKQPGTFELGLASDLHQLTRRLQIKLVSIEHVSKLAREDIYRASS